MKLTSREKLLIGLLGVAILVYAEGSFVLKGQLESINTKQQERKALVERVKLLANSKQIISELDGQIANGLTMVSGVLDKHFVTSPQEDLILVVHDRLGDTGVNAKGFNYEMPGDVVVSGTPIKHAAVVVEFNGTYESLNKFMKKAWDFPKMVVVDGFTLNRLDTGMLDGTIALGFYYMPGVENVGYNDNLYRYISDEAFLKGNPFGVSAGAGDYRINYEYIGGDEKTFKYVPFTDIKGHWAEKEITQLGEAGAFPESQINTFKPDEVITRGEFVMIMDRYFQWPESNEPIDLNRFTDLAELGSYETSMRKAIARGFMGGMLEGFPDNTLKPKAPMTYQDVETLVRKLKNDPGFQWATIASELNSRGIPSDGLTDVNAGIKKAEAVYLMTKLK